MVDSMFYDAGRWSLESIKLKLSLCEVWRLWPDWWGVSGERGDRSVSLMASAGADQVGARAELWSLTHQLSSEQAAKW